MPRKSTPPPEDPTAEGTNPVDDRTRERQRLIEDIAWLLARWFDRRRPSEESDRHLEPETPVPWVILASAIGVVLARRQKAGRPIVGV